MHVHLGTGLCIMEPSKSPKWTGLVIRKRLEPTATIWSCLQQVECLSLSEGLQALKTFYLIEPGPPRYSLKISTVGSLADTCKSLHSIPRLVVRWFAGALRFVPWRSHGEAVWRVNTNTEIPLQTLRGHGSGLCCCSLKRPSEHGAIPPLCASAGGADGLILYYSWVFSQVACRQVHLQFQILRNLRGPAWAT